MQSTTMTNQAATKTTTTATIHDGDADTATTVPAVTTSLVVCDWIASKSQILTWVPYILIMVLAGFYETLSISLAFGIAVFLGIFNYKYAKYRPEFSSWYYLDMALVVSLLGLCIANFMVYIPPTILQGVPSAAMLLAVIISMIIRDPFTKQYAKPHVPSEVFASAEFTKMNDILSGYWLLIFVVINVCQWCSLLFVTSFETSSSTSTHPTISNFTAFLMLGTIIPSAVPIAGIFGMNLLIKYLKRDFNEQNNPSESTAANTNDGANDV